MEAKRIRLAPITVLRGIADMIVSPTMALKSEGCSVKAALIAELQAAHIVALHLSNQESEHIIAGDFGAYAELEKDLKDARQHRDGTLAALRSHIAEHGC